MKIVERKEPLQDWKLEIICKDTGWNQEGKTPCGSQLEIEKEDVLFREWSKYPDESGTEYGVICPVCGCFIEITKSKLPDLAKTHAKSYLEAIRENKKKSDYPCDIKGCNSSTRQSCCGCPDMIK